MLKQLIIFIFISVFLGLSQAAGVGGGPLVNICLMICMGYDAKLSISVTYIFLIGGSIASIWRNSQKINPKTGKTDVNLDLILLTIPSMVSGALFGGILKNFISQLIITILFIALFVYLIWDLRRMMALSHIQSNKENQKLRIDQQLKEVGIIQPLVQKQEINASQDSQLIKEKLIYLIKLAVVYYIFTAFTSLVRGGLRYNSIIGLNSCGLPGWVILFIHFAVSVYLSNHSAKKIIQASRLYSKKQDVSEENVWYFLLGGFSAGLVGATLALGGALILIPVWIKMGINKQVATSSTPGLILISALVAATVAYFNNIYSSISGLTSFIYLVLAFASTTIMRQIISDIAIKYKVKQLVIVLLLVVVVISLVVLIPYQGSKMIRNFDHFISLGYLC